MARASKSPTIKPIMALKKQLIQEDCTLGELCETLKICQATARNWIKSGRIKAIDNVKPLQFKRKEIEKLRLAIESGKLTRLTSRRNKRHKKGLQIPNSALNHALYGPYVHQLMALLLDKPLQKKELSLVLAEYALRLLVQRGFIVESITIVASSAQCSFLKAYKEGRLPLGEVKPLVDDLIGDLSDLDFSEDFEHLLSQLQIPEAYDEDFLGLIYMLLQCIGYRKAKGVYYTSMDLVKSSVERLLSCEPSALDGCVLDPCCGTGQFILRVITHKQKEKGHRQDGAPDYSGCHGFDVDPVSICLTRLNIVLLTGQVHLKALYEQFRIQDTLQDHSGNLYDCILGNPPWGYAFSDQEIATLVSQYALLQGKQSESYGLFVEWALNHLKPGAWLTYILPEAALTVKVHKLLRKMIHQSTDIRAIDFIENAFSGVYMPAIALHLQMKSTDEKPTKIRVLAQGHSHYIVTDRYDGQGAYNLRAPDEAFRMIVAMDQKAKSRLEGQVAFALGIVTGDNKGSLYKSRGLDRVPVLVGPDVHPYTLKRPSHFVDSLKNFQQKAPLSYYQAQEKLVYRFIADRPIVAYDNDKLWTLNSCNCMIPSVEGYSMKIIMALLNASPIQFYYKTRFPSMKVLRGHLEALPIPKLTKEQKEKIECHCNDLLSKPNEELRRHHLQQIDDIISDAFELSEEERNFLVKTLRIKGDAYAR